MMIIYSILTTGDNKLNAQLNENRSYQKFTRFPPFKQHIQPL